MIRELQKEDRKDLVSVIKSIPIFNDEEKNTAIELIDETLENEEKNVMKLQSPEDVVLFMNTTKRQPVTIALEKDT